MFWSPGQYKNTVLDPKTLQKYCFERSKGSLSTKRVLCLDPCVKVLFKAARFDALNFWSFLTYGGPGNLQTLQHK